MQSYNLFIGRFQSPHKGHMKLFNEYLSKGEPVLIAIRDVKDEVLSSEQVKLLFEKLYEGNELVKVIIIPDIASVNYGRDVGYLINKITLDNDSEQISATKIREGIISGDDEWKKHIDKSIQKELEKFIKNNNELHS